jgi:hypothetical protein
MADVQHDFQAGETLRVKAASYRRQGDKSVARIMRGQTMQVNDKDLKRSDAHLIFERPSDEEMEQMEPGEAVQPDDERFVNFNYAAPEYDHLKTLMESMNVRDTKHFLSNDEWQPDSLSLALDAEVAGKDRDSIKEYIEGRIEQMDQEEGPAA